MEERIQKNHQRVKYLLIDGSLARLQGWLLSSFCGLPYELQHEPTYPPSWELIASKTALTQDKFFLQNSRRDRGNY